MRISEASPMPDLRREGRANLPARSADLRTGPKHAAARLLPFGSTIARNKLRKRIRDAKR
jgi:hypothetical protein